MVYIHRVAGEEEPFLRKNRASYERIGKVVCEFGVKINDCLSFDDSVVLLLAIPEENLEAVERVLKCSLVNQEAAKGAR